MAVTGTTRRTTSSAPSSPIIEGKHQAQPHSSLVNLLIMGPPGSGKGTYGTLLAKRLNADLITAGDILRDHVSRGTETGVAIKECQRLGRLADDNLVADAVRSYLIERYGVVCNFNSGHDRLDAEGKHPSRKVRFILDGYPRTENQADIMEGDGWPSHLRADVAVSIDVPDKICVDKVLGRRICRQCGGNFNITDVHDDGFIMPPTLPNPPCECDKSVNWVKREDDSKDIISSRLADFHLQTAPIIRHYERIGEMLHFRPYRGIQDMDELEKIVMKYFDWVDDV